MRKYSDRIFLWTLLITQILICVLSLILINMLATNNLEHTGEVLNEHAMLMSKDKMQERIDTMIRNIERERTKTLTEVAALGEFVTHPMTHEHEDRVSTHLAEMLPHLSASKYGQAIQVLLYDEQTKAVTLFSQGQSEDITAQYGSRAKLERNVKRCPYYKIVTNVDTTLYIFATQESLDAVSKSFIYDMVHDFRYGENGYVWVNEVLNYEGGDDYAIRLIHPNMKDTEGQYLSTNMTDANGGFPYLEELEGIREDGEIFYTYYFQNTSDGQVTEKASYAKLYEPFDWILATGDPLDDVLAYVTDSEEYNRQVFSNTLRIIIVSLIAAFVVDLAVIVFSNRRYREMMRRNMEENTKRSEQLFNIVAQHSNRILYEYDLSAGTTRPWDETNKANDILAHLYSGNYSDDSLEENEFVLPDSVEKVKKFFAEIYEGKPTGEANVHIRLLDGQLKWYHFRYSGIYHDGQPETALISIEDITERHEYELTHLRHVETLKDNKEGHLIYIDCDLTADRVENLSGQLLTAEEKATRGLYSELRQSLLNLKFRYEDFVQSSRYFSRENLLEQYAKGERKLKSEWKVHFNDYHPHWLSAEVVMMTDPFNNHVKASIGLWDVTEELEEKQSILHRADHDAMTGLLRKDVGEAQIKKHLESRKEKGGILIVLDLDDLKGINDTLGHKQGDAAIIGIAEMLKGHFRKDDILVRAGGDEFMAYLPGAGQSVDAVEISLTSLLKKLSEICVGENRERMICCSAGCAVEELGRDTYDTLFKRADTALYHVKRNGKNNYAFYVAEMEQADYEFRSKALLSKRNDKKFELPELQHLLDSIIKFYQLVLSVNLSGNTYHMMEEVKDGVFARVPSFGSLDGFVQLAAKPVHPDDVDAYYGHLSRNALLQAREGGAESVRHYFRFFDRGKYRRIECMVIFYENDKGDVCDFTLLRWDDDHNCEQN